VTVQTEDLLLGPVNDEFESGFDIGMIGKVRHEQDSRQSPSRSGEISKVSRHRFAGFWEKVPFK
jgi:hypothetical protein